jgi:hypothetical protein
MTERVEVFDADGTMTPFESAEDAHRFALRESLYGGRIEITDELGYTIVEHIRQTDDPSRLNIEFILGPFQPSELEAFEMTVVQGQKIHGVDALIASPEVRKVAMSTDITVRMWKPSLSDDWFMGAYDGDDLIAMAPGQTFKDAFDAIGVDVEERLDDS